MLQSTITVVIISFFEEMKIFLFASYLINHMAKSTITQKKSSQSPKCQIPAAPTLKGSASSISRTNAIDAIFQDKKKKKSVNDDGSREPDTKSKTKSGAFKKRDIPKRKEIPNNEDLFSDPRGKLTASRRMEDGTPIFTWEEMKIGQGGDTDLCPFDCQCCF